MNTTNKRFEILCVTMRQHNFSKIQEMNIHSDVLFANQADTTNMSEICFEGHTARMITTATRGVGTNRNLALLHARGEICLFADDDIRYNDDVESLVTKEFDAHPDADIIIFNLQTDSHRKPVCYSKTKKCSPLCRMPWGGARIAFRLASIQKANVWFTTLFGGGALFPSGEDSIWLSEIRKKGLTFYVSKEIIGHISYDTSSWFTGYDQRFFYSKGAFCEAVRFFPFPWVLYYLWRFRRHGQLDLHQKYLWMKHGQIGYRTMCSYDEYIDMLSN